MQPVPAIRAENISVAFSGVKVLRDVSLDIRQGEIHGLVGENGAGKSTLGKVIGGYYAMSAGELAVFGEKPGSWNPPVALAHGVAIMHQELQLVPDMTVAQNVFLGLENARWGVLFRDEVERLEELMRSSGFRLDPESVTVDLSIADQQKIEILRALARDARVIVMDEPTSSLSKGEVKQLHDAMRTLRRDGRSVVYVSHFLEDILAVTDRVTVLRDGRHVKTVRTSGESRGSLVSAMLGQGKTETPFPAKRPPDNPTTRLKITNLGSESGVSNVTLKIGEGEIVGLVGMVGSGRSEIARAILGADLATAGDVELNGQPYRRRTPAKSSRLGLVMVPEDRRRQGLVMSMRVRENISLPHLHRFARAGIVKRIAERTRAQELIEFFRIRPPEPDGDVATFSGGNQQKVLFGKWLAEDPDVIILDEPSRGVDVGARQRIHEAIAELALNGTAFLLISSEIEEVLGLSHRIYLVDRGMTVRELSTEGQDEATLLSELFSLQAGREQAEAT